MKSVYINEEDLYNEQGSARSITPSCFSALRRLANQGELNKNVFIVQESILVNSMLYDANNTDTGEANAQINIKKLINFKPRINYNYKNKNILEIKEPRYIAFRAFLLTKYTDTGLTSIGSAIVQAEPLSLKDIKNRIKE